MASIPRTREAVEYQPYIEPSVFRFTNDYVKRLLIERYRIRARLENPGGSVILQNVAATTEQLQEYSQTIGNTFHLDLIDAEDYVRKLNKADRKLLTDWINGLTAEKAAEYYQVKPKALQKRRERVIAHMKEALIEGEES